MKATRRLTRDEIRWLQLYRDLPAPRARSTFLRFVETLLKEAMNPKKRAALLRWVDAPIPPALRPCAICGKRDPRRFWDADDAVCIACATAAAVVPDARRSTQEGAR